MPDDLTPGGGGRGPDPAYVEALLEQLSPGGLSDELRAAFKADTKLMGLLGEFAKYQGTLAAVEQARADIKAKKPAPRIPRPGAQPALGGTYYPWDYVDNPALAPWQEQYDRADALLSQYYADAATGSYEQASPALKTLQANVDRLVTSIQNQKGVVQTRLAKEGAAPTATNPPDLVWLPTGTPGEERAHVYDPGAKTYVPATDAKGNPIPTRKVAQPQQPAPRIAEGTQSWDLKQMEDGTWWQVPTIARADGSFELDTKSGRMPQRAQGMPAGKADVQVVDGVPYVVGADGRFQPAPGYVKPPMFRTDGQGRGYISTDNGATWKPSTGLPGTPQTMTSDGVVYPLDENGLPLVDRGVRVPQGVEPQTIDGYLVQVDPRTGGVTRTDLYTPEQRARFEQLQGISLETAQTNLQTAQANLSRAQQLQDPLAEYQRQVQLSQTAATKYRDDLNQQVLEGRLSVEDASKQFDDWWGTNVEAKLSPYQTMAQTAYRKEQNEYLQQQAAEQARVEALNRQREQLGYQAGEKARQDLMTLAPQGRSPEFLQQLAQNVSRIGQPLPGGVTQHAGGMQFSPESLSLDAVRRSQPSLTQVGQQAVARALSQISPAAAQQVGVAPPTPMSLPDMQGFMNRAPFSIPNPALPVPGQEALDLGNPANAARLGLPVQPGFAGTRYQGGRVEPWAIPAA